jgi:hypothetical protein
MTAFFAVDRWVEPQPTVVAIRSMVTVPGINLAMFRISIRRNFCGSSFL